MLRCAALLLAEVTKAASTSGAAAATKGPTKRKSKWIDRHSYKVHHNGKDAFSVFDQPSCELCHVRFRYKQDYEVHKDSLMHRDRLRWEEKTKWFQNEGEPVLRKKTEEEWDWYVQNVLKPQAARQNVEVSQLTQQIRRAIHVPKPGHSRSVDYPSVVQEIVEPLQQRWALVDSLVPHRAPFFF